MNWKEVDGKHDNDDNQHFRHLSPGLELVDEVPVDVGPLASLGLVRYPQGGRPSAGGAGAAGFLPQADLAAAGQDSDGAAGGGATLASSLVVKAVLHTPTPTQDLLAPKCLADVVIKLHHAHQGGGVKYYPQLSMCRSTLEEDTVTK